MSNASKRLGQVISSQFARDSLKRAAPFLSWVAFFVVVWVASVSLVWQLLKVLGSQMPEAVKQGVFANILNVLSVAVGTGVVWKLVDLLTPSLSFSDLSKEKPHLMVALVVAILLAVAYIVKTLAVTSVPLP